MSDAPRILLSTVPDGGSLVFAVLEHLGARPEGGYCPSADLSCDGLMLCGGGDLESTLFGQENCGSDPPDPARDRAELALFRAFYEAGKPILGVCRGMQVINVALGGDLIQDLPGDLLPFHGRADHDLVHPIRTAEGSLLRELYGPVFPVNSIHHQAIGALGQGLRATAWAEGGFCEAFAHETRPIWGYQFHPERMTHPKPNAHTVDGGAILSHFLAHCR